MTLPRLLVLYDVPGWAFHGEAVALSQYLAGHWTVDLCASRALTTALLRAADVVYGMAYYGPGWDHPKSVTSISSTSYFTRREKRMDGFPEALRRWGRVIVKNQELGTHLTDDDHPHRTVLYHLLDVERFRPCASYGTRDPLVVGYAGHDRALKGLDLIQAAAKAAGWHVKTALYGPHALAPDEMPGWYAGLDAYACMSRPGHDAGPNPPMQAGLCGVPVITTSVGQIGEMVRDGVNGLVIDRTVDSLVEALLWLADDLEIRRLVGECAADVFRTRWGDDVGRSYLDFFNDYISN